MVGQLVEIIFTLAIGWKMYCSDNLICLLCSPAWTQIHYIDFEGRSDGQSAQYILRRVRPRNLVVIHGDHSSTEVSDAVQILIICLFVKLPYTFPINSQHFAEHAATNADDVNMRMFTPQRGEDVDITAERQIYQVGLVVTLFFSPAFGLRRSTRMFKLSNFWSTLLCSRQIKLRDALVGALEFEEVGDMKLAWVDGVVAMQRAATATSEAQGWEDLYANQIYSVLGVMHGHPPHSKQFV